MSNDLDNVKTDLGVLSKYSGKKISIIGDSIDTYNKAGYKIDGYNMYYPTLDVTSVNYTWWMQVINAVGATLEVNASFSGSRLTNTHSDPTYPSLYDRVSLIGNPDIIFITLGTNDSNAAVALGVYDYETPYEDLPENTFRGAYIKGIKALQALYPSAQIVCVTEKMGSTNKKEVAIIAHALGVDYVDASDYVAQSGSHPGKKGMVQIAKAILNPTDKNLMFSGIPADGAAVGEVKSDLLAMGNLELVDLSDKITVGTNNRYIGANSGGTGTDNDAYITGYIDISKYVKIRYSMFKTTMTASVVDAGMCFYDENKTFIKGIKGIKSAPERGYVISIANVPDNAVYAKFSVQKDSETYGKFVLEGMLPFIGTIDNLYNAIDEMRDAVPLEMLSGYIATNTGVGTTVDLDTITESSANFKYCITQCVEGDKFSLSGTGGVAPRLWCFLDSDKTILSVSDASISATNLVITAPKNAAYCIVQSNDSTKTSYKGVSINIRVNELGTYIDEIPEIEDTAYALSEIPPIIKTNYDNNGNAHLRILEGNTGITQLDIKRQGSRLTIDGHFVSTNADGYGYIGLNNPLRRTVTPNTVKTWTSNLSLKSGHSYIISLRQIAGTVTKATGAYVAISVYKQGENSSVGAARGTKNGQIRYFTADDSKYNVVFFLYGELTFDNAVFEIILEDRWCYNFNSIANTSLLYKGTDARGVQGGVLHDCMIYSYCYAGWHGLRKVDLRTGVQTEREVNLGHGNDMTWYNGKLYLASMESTGRIYIIDPDTLAVDSYVDFQMDETQRDNSGIAYDSKSNRFVIKTNNGFAFADTSLNFESFVSREYLSGATGQGIETDGYYIYVMESYSGASGGRIDVYNFDGSWVDTILITKTGEPETLCYENGAWWYFNNIESPTSWEVCGILINRQLNTPALASYARYFGKV